MRPLNFSFTGGVGVDPEVKQTKAGKNFVRFAVATEPKRDETLWVSCAAFGDNAKFINDHVRKGQVVSVFGAGSVREYEGKVYADCRVDSVNIVMGKKRDDAPAAQPVTQQATQPADDDDDNIPF